jgi:transmembrane sensor
MNQTDDQVRVAITAQAAEWFAAHRGGALDEHRRAAFFAWLKTSPLHIEEYLAVAAIESDLAAATADSTLSLDALRELARSDNTGNVTTLPSAAPLMDRVAPRLGRPKRRRWRALAWGTVAAATVVAATVAVGIAWGVLDLSWLRLPKTYQTASGIQSVWHLPDGSVLHLNGDSAVTARFSSGERRIDIDHGQAFFEVAHDGSRPFRVIAGTVSTVAIGTEFDVARRVDTTVITVVQGQVAVFPSPAGTVSSGGAAGPPPPGSLHVGAGQQVHISAGQLPEAATAADLYQAEAWLQRQIVFKHQPLGEVAAEFSRYNAIRITITDPALSALPVSGVFNAYDIDSFMSFLRSLDHVQVDQLPTGIRVSRTRAKPLA